MCPRRRVHCRQDLRRLLSGRDAQVAVERQFEIIGEALNRLAKLDARVAEGITYHRRIIAFRNILVHAYARIDDRVVWGIVDSNLATLTAEVDALLGDGSGS